MPVRRGSGRSARRITSFDVAAEAGVSQATVARAYSAPEKVSPATRARVRSAADRLGYVPNAIARSLKSQRTNIVGAVVPAVGEYWQGVVTLLSRRLAEQGLQLLLFSFSDRSHVEEAVAAVDQYRLDGLILASSTIGPDILGSMPTRGLPVVAFNQPAAAGIVPSVSVDNEAGGRDLARHLIGQGAASALFVGGVASASTDQLRYRGAAQTFADAGIACPYLEAGAFSYEAGYKAATAVLDRGPLPHAIMVAADEPALGLVDGLRQAGVAVAGEVMVTGFDGLPQAEWAGYELTTLVQDTDALAVAAVELLTEQRHAVTGPVDAMPPSIVVGGTLRVGATTGAITARSEHG